MATLAKFAVIGLGVLCVSSLSVGAFAAWDIASSIKPGIHLSHASGYPSQELKNIAAIAGGVNLLLVGTDTRTNQGGDFSSKDQLAGSSGAGSNDVTVLLHISQDHTNATVVSFPRDTIIPIPRCTGAGGRSYLASSADMLNTTLARGGLSCTVSTIEKLTGLQIPFAAEISFDGVIAMSNAVGGVTVCLATPLNDEYTDPPLKLAAGTQTIVGPEALSFLRSRHGVADGSDLGRISNQQVFLSALVRKIKSAGVLGNPVALYSLAKAAVTNMQLSDTLTDPTTLVQIGLALKGIGLDNVVFLQYPTVADPADFNRVIPDASAARVLDAALRADQPVQLTGAPGRGAVLAATPTPSASVPVASAPSTSTPTQAPTHATSAPSSSQIPSPTATATAPATLALPTTVSGQTAAQQTCTKGNKG